MEKNGISKVSIIVPAKNEATNVKMTVVSLIQTQSSVPYEIIVIDDGSEDNCCLFLKENESYWQDRGVKLIRTEGIGLANAKNLGADNATGDVLVFSDAHVVVEKNWLEIMIRTMSEPGVDVLTPAIADYSNPQNVGFGQTWNERLEIVWLPAPGDVTPIPLAPGGFEVVKKKVFETVGGFDRGFKIWGYEDVEFSFKCWLFGFGVYATPLFTIRHVFRPRHTYFVSFNETYYNLMRMALSHFNNTRMAKTINMIRTAYNFENIIAEVTFSNVWDQRKHYLANRKYDDDWFMNKFKILY